MFIASSSLTRRQRISQKALQLFTISCIKLGLLKTKSFSIGGQFIEFHDLQKSNILQQIAIGGIESYEPEVAQLVKNYSHFTCPKYFFDVGANIGFYSVLAEAYFPQEAHVFAVEPFPANAHYLRQLKEHNQLNFTIIEKALDEYPDLQKKFYFPTAINSSQLSASASIINSFRGTDGIFKDLPYQTIDIMTETLDRVIASKCEADGSILIKLDCEGNELPILKSATLTLKRHDVDFIIELMINDRDKYEIFDLMKSFGYEGFLITNAGLVREDRPLTFPFPGRRDRTIWKNHFFTKKTFADVEKFSRKNYGYWI